MKSLLWNGNPRRGAARAETEKRSHAASVSSAGPALNTILVVREHAPAEIDELATEITALHTRLGVAHARKRLLEQLLSVITESDAEDPVPQSGMSVIR